MPIAMPRYCSWFPDFNMEKLKCFLFYSLLQIFVNIGFHEERLINVAFHHVWSFFASKVTKL